MFLEKCPFAIARIIAQYFLTTIRTIQDVLQRELGMKRFSQRWVLHFVSSAQKAARVEESEEMLRILQRPEANQFEGIAMGDKSWFRHSYSSSKMFARSAVEVIPRTRQENYDQVGIHHKETNRSGLPAARSQIQLAIFHGLYFSGFENGKPELSSSDARVNF
jgi:hypothetical protein